tara:strand:- start:351 stop:548 length:198 start_codon:yes stop_codon:yes gene_type:complete
MIVVSMLTKAPDQKQLYGLTYSTTAKSDKESSNNSWTNYDLINSAVIIGILALILIYFSPLGIGG